MKYYCLLLLIAVKTINGFGFHSAMPFQMEFEIPEFPAMNAMRFPPIFNPIDAMQRDSMGAETRGLDMDEVMGNITTKNKTEVKDGFKVTTITRNGPGFHSYIKEYERDGNNTKNGSMDIGKLMGSSSLFNIMKQLKNIGKDQQTKCKKSKGKKFYDPIFQLCRKKFSEGRTCMFQKQCGKSLRCQWGKCQKAKAGDPGTFCKANSQCNGEACCRNTPGSFHLMCIPRQSEGAICGLKKESFSNVLYIVKRSVAPSCTPCENGLKCADTGDSKYQRCVKQTYIERAADELEDDNPSNALGNNDDDDDNDNSGDDKDEKEIPGGEGNPMKGVPPKASPPKSKHPIDDKKGDWKLGSDNKKKKGDDDKEDEDEEKDEAKNEAKDEAKDEAKEEDEDDEDKKEDKKVDDENKDDNKGKIKQGTGAGILITPSNKGKTKEGKEKTKGKSST